MAKKNKNHPPIVAATSKKQRQGGPAKKKDEAFTKPSDKNIYIALFIILLVSFIIYLPSLNNEFVNWDDDVYVQNNPLMHYINLKELFSSYAQGNYHPLTMLAYAVEYHFFGLSVKGYHLVSLLLHLANIILVYFIILLLSKKTEVALVACLLFGIHPLHVESVAWISELKDLLYTFFFLAAYICYLKYLGTQQRKFILYSILLFLVSLLSKAMAVSLPVLLLLTDYFMGRKMNTKTLLEKVPFFVLSLLFGVIAVMAQKSSEAIQDSSVFTSLQHIAFAGYGFITYLQKLVLPVGLSAFYPYPLKNGMDIPSWYYLYLVVFLLVVAGVIYSIRSSKKIIFGVGFFMITVFLVLQLLPVGDVIMADRYSYIPSIGIFYLAGEGFYWLLQKKKKTVAIALLSVAALFFSVTTYARCEVWKDSMTLWNDVINQYQTVAAAYNNRGTLYKAQKQYDEAFNDFNKVVELRPHDSKSYYNRGLVYMAKEQWDKALEDFNHAIKLKEDYEAYNNRGVVYVNKKNFDEALKDFNKAIELMPNYTEVYLNRGNLFLDQNKYDPALTDFSKAIELEPNSPQAYYNRARIEYTEGKKDIACMDLQQAINLKFAAAEDAYRSLCH